jgi:hypothetical protein
MGIKSLLRRFLTKSNPGQSGRLTSYAADGTIVPGGKGGEPGLPGGAGGAWDGGNGGPSPAEMRYARENMRRGPIS